MSVTMGPRNRTIDEATDDGGGVPRRTQEERRTTAEVRLVEAAAEIISESGLAAITLAKVGERAGYSRGLVTHHFGSKSGLMQRVADAVTQQFVELLTTQGQSSDSALADVHTFVRTYVDVVSHPRPINRAQLMMIADSVANPESDARESVIGFDKVLRRHLATIIRQAVDTGELDSLVDANALAAVIVGTLRGVSFEAILDPRVNLTKVGQEIDRLLSIGAPRRRGSGTTGRR